MTHMKLKKLKKAITKVAKTLTEEILAMFYASPLTFSEAKRQFHGLPIRKKVLTSKQLYYAVKRAKKRGWLEEKKIQDKVYFSLTKEGQFKQKMLKIQLQPKRRGTTATVIVFDIPETKSSYRHFLRRLLVRSGFTMLQKSVFITPYVLSKELYDLLKELDLLQYLMIIEGQIRFAPPQ